ncbi:hypothetical protein ABB37_09988 [Leptomonas pyrrhocoris]|uniref:Uncharacterized protein n=1 Tax=Leptomonas pyrrhocoris TaxID=157538 RepID=A0A0N0VCL9_LEPPY|nr:hypothetical protein ABB37_09988 [Leptomonas pyrrhocoris]XP_015651717.1 hypothetical protein ABB37_09988 [Leptomonas pyrrhocoris]XP_015651718.1 hypothetical protein ABB37_09988 [Leptomonas pyrrhocoris]KPA73277.1 hypothetical protein ABB37_09988 [Leptomonas pyrrhocoris]KPA73278.1 hypothetical protein ABB37_09988 [Leptomonas pyrrhocoris]KPA73279.1 hypothetical protein ABB37_09988 [Leptomonas pyrrhocoris]|eukprot:XP_015651716.1 hypothetical protein ABB37_09988 [Leptomonas pyrrhocoris]
MSARAFMVEEEYEDFTDDVPLKLHSVLEFLDDVKAVSMDSTTEHQQISSNDSESEEDVPSAEFFNSLRLTPFIAATTQPHPCYCLDKANCMCNLFSLPPLLPLRPSTPAAVEYRVLSSSPPAEKAAAPTRMGLSTSTTAAEGMHFVPLHLAGLHLAKLQGGPRTLTTASSSTSTTTTTMTTTCCRC